MLEERKEMTMRTVVLSIAATIFAMLAAAVLFVAAGLWVVLTRMEDTGKLAAMARVLETEIVCKLLREGDTKEALALLETIQVGAYIAVFPEEIRQNLEIMRVLERREPGKLLVVDGKLIVRDHRAEGSNTGGR